MVTFIVAHITRMVIRCRLPGLSQLEIKEPCGGVSALHRVQERRLPAGEGKVCVHSFIQTYCCRLCASSDAPAPKERVTSTVIVQQHDQGSDDKTLWAAGAQRAPDPAWGRAGCAGTASGSR